MWHTFKDEHATNVVNLTTHTYQSWSYCNFYNIYTSTMKTVVNFTTFSQERKNLYYNIKAIAILL